MNNKLFQVLGNMFIASVFVSACASPLQPAAVQAPPVQVAVGTTPTTVILQSPVPILPEATTNVPSLEDVLTYPIVDTGQQACYNDVTSISCPGEEESFHGQDAQYAGNTPRYQDNGDGTVSDQVTGLMWQQNPGEKMTYEQAMAGADGFSLAGYDDWRLPTIKELFSLIQFSGTDASICMAGGACNAVPFIDAEIFDFAYGDAVAGDRIIDSQWATSSVYTGKVFGNQQAMFGVNFADGRIKGYPTGAGQGGPGKTYFVLYVRGNPGYGVNHFIDNGNGTVTDEATGLAWTQNDSGQGLNWADALAYCSNLELAGMTDWRLPSAKELQSVVDYSRSPDATGSAAIDPVFTISSITNEAGQLDYPAFWSSTTHVSANGSSSSAVYLTFGRALGYMNGQWMDVHGAGAQRAESKSGDPAQFPTGHGPQGDAVRIYNYVRCVTGNSEGTVQTGGGIETKTVTQHPATEIPQAQSSPGQGPQGGGQPPQEAIEACSGLNQDAACAFNTPNGLITGSCRTVQSGQLACVPAGGPP